MSDLPSHAAPHPAHCECRASHTPRLVVVTGGPGAGKTAVLEMVQRQFCEHVVVLPESAGILYGGGFPRRTEPPARRAGQRAIFVVQRELERLALETSGAAVILCDRGTLDGFAYWPGEPESFFAEMGTTLDAELERYAAVVHLRTPSNHDGFGHQNPLRIETAREAHAIDLRIASVWKNHARYVAVPSSHDFLVKTQAALAAIRAEIPPCCGGAAPTPG